MRWVLWSARLLPYRLLRPCFSFTIGNLLPVFIRAEAEKNLRLAFGAALTPADRSRLIRRVARNLGLFVAETLAMKRRDGTVEFRLVGPVTPAVLDQHLAAILR